MKNPPTSIDAEQAVIGCVLMSPSCFDEVAYLDTEDFYFKDTRDIWSIMRRSESSRDLISLFDLCETNEQKIYIGELARTAISAANVKVYGAVVKERAILRRLLSECMAIMGDISNASRPSDVIASAMRRLEAVGEGAIVGTGPRHIGDIARDWRDEIAKRTDTSYPVGLLTPFDALNERWGGLRGGQVIVIAGRPKTGKTTLACNIAEYIARTHPVAIFQMEMNEMEVIDRAISAKSSVGIKKIRNGSIQSEDWDSLTDAVASLRNSKLYIDATPRQTMDYIRMHGKAFVKKHGKGAIMIDYLGLIRSDMKGKTKNDEIAEISRDIKLLAKETDCPVILLCQMNRAVEREKRKPQLSDLRDSGAIEQDADVICFTHKEDPEQEYSEIISRAMRSGEPGTDYLICEFGVSRFANPPLGWEPPRQSDKRYEGGLK